MFILALLQAATLVVPLTHVDPAVNGSIAGDAWKGAQSITLDWDLQGHKRAPQQTTAYIESDGKFLYVAFDAKQDGTITATQHTDDAGQGTDDDVEIDLWPGGNNGFMYQFVSNPIGTHYQYSSENSGYRPQWWSAGSVRSGEYVVTMKIPLDAIHGVNSKTWLVQFARKVENTGDIDVWSYNPNATDTMTSTYAGSMTGLQTTAVKPQPRLELYTLGLVGGKSIGGSTSRLGADFSIPFTATSSFYATIHPDYSNVELDQQSISPTAFRRYLSEVRPFFTQANAPYNNFNCDLCSGITTLYTPSIPTPRDGYAVEGKQGRFTYGAFDAIGNGRSDTAQALDWSNASRTLRFSAQRVGVYTGSVLDNSQEYGLDYFDQKHFGAWFNYGTDAGTNVADKSRAALYDFGSVWQSPTFIQAIAIRHIGQYFNPVDGFVWHPDIAGWGHYQAKSWLFQKGAPLRSITASTAIDRYHDHTGELDQTDQSIDVDFLTRGLMDVNIATGSSFVRLQPNGTFHPVSQNGINVTFGSGADNSNVNNGAQHGASATPTTIGWFGGRFGPGRLNSWIFNSTMRAMRQGLVTFELDGNIQQLDAGPRYTQWLERVSYTYQADRDTSFALGVRRIIGTPPMLDTIPQYQNGWNLSAAYHRTFNGVNEIYAVYGDASAFSTVPQFVVKWIRYFGAGKGT